MHRGQSTPYTKQANAFRRPGSFCGGAAEPRDNPACRPPGSGPPVNDGVLNAKLGRRGGDPQRACWRRPRKGVPNKTTVLLKCTILKAPDQAGGEAGLVGYLRIQAETNPTLHGSARQMLPMQVTGGDGRPVGAAVTVVERRIVRPLARKAYRRAKTRPQRQTAAGLVRAEQEWSSVQR
jgi:hypothetical protein